MWACGAVTTLHQLQPAHFHARSCRVTTETQRNGEFSRASWKDHRSPGLRVSVVAGPAKAVRRRTPSHSAGRELTHNGTVKIYTRTGDSGETGLFDGTRVPKSDPRVVAYGDVDELNAWLGLARASGSERRELREMLERIQRDLFALGARLADPANRIAERVTKAAVTAEDIARLEGWIDQLEAELPPLRRFILAGGSATAAAAARGAHGLPPRRARDRGARARGLRARRCSTYVNRLSDLLFVLARAANRARRRSRKPSGDGTGDRARRPRGAYAACAAARAARTTRTSRSPRACCRRRCARTSPPSTRSRASPTTSPTSRARPRPSGWRLDDWRRGASHGPRAPTRRGAWTDDPIFDGARAHHRAARPAASALLRRPAERVPQDVTTTRYGTWHDVLDYCRRSANPVGPPRAAHRRRTATRRSTRSSDAVCTALQLTNFWQDFGRDWHHGRLYVPLEERDRHGARDEDLDAGRITTAWKRAIEAAVGRTRASSAAAVLSATACAAGCAGSCA